MKFLKRFFLVLVIVVAILEIFFLVSGKTYMNKLLWNTVFKGRLGPTINEYHIYHNREVKALSPREWQQHTEYNTFRMTDDMSELHAKYGTIGFGVFVDGKILFDHYWDDFSDSSKTNSWSMAKSIISHLIGVAQHQGLIESLDDPYSRYVSGFHTGDVTIRQLLSMSSGIDFDENYLNPFSYPARSLYDNDLRGIMTDYQPAYEAGKYFDYQSGNSQLLAFLLEDVTGMKISDYASEYLWGPIGARYDALWSLDGEDGTERAFCCFNSNVRDFAKFGQLYLDSGIVNRDTLIDPSFYAQATNGVKLIDKADDTQWRGYGYQWWVYDEGDEHIFYSRGIDGQYIFVIPDWNAVVVRLGHKRSKEKYLKHPIDAIAYLEQAKMILRASGQIN